MREAPWSVALTWRGWLPVCPNFLKIDVAAVDLTDPALLQIPAAGLDGLEGAEAFA